MRSLGGIPTGIPGGELAAAKRAYRPRSPVESAIALAPQPRDQPGFQTPTVSQGGDLRGALVSSLTQASQSHSGDLTQALGLIQQMQSAAQAKAAQASAGPAIQPMGVGGPAAGSHGQSAPQGAPRRKSHGSASGYITHLAQALGIDPKAARAVASVEGGLNFGGPVGDSGTSGGPYQLHRGGALPSGQSVAWAATPQGVAYALRAIARVARGKHGLQAVEAIVRRFERPANPGAEVQKAWGRYGHV